MDALGLGPARRTSDVAPITSSFRRYLSPTLLMQFGQPRRLPRAPYIADKGVQAHRVRQTGPDAC